MAENHDAAKPFISICIPTFNRGKKVYQLVTEILKHKGNEIEVVVLDNCSTDETADLLLAVHDSRFRFIRNESNIGGIINLIRALSLAKGKYAFLCLDKDFLHHDNIERLVEKLKTADGVVMGRCVLNLQQETADVIYDKGFPSLLHMAFQSEHPTGTFYDAALYKKLAIIERIYKNPVKFGFYVDLINAEMAMRGKAQLINLPLFSTETKEDCSDVPSFTYTAKDVFFSPESRMKELAFYLDTASQLNLPKNELLTLTKKLYLRILSAATFGYKKTLSDKYVCVHYGTATRNVTIAELFTIARSFARYFTQKQMTVSGWNRRIIIARGRIFFYTAILSLIVKSNG